MPTQRRSHGSGSVYQDAGGRWIGSMETGRNRSGQRDRIRVVRKTKIEAQRALVAKAKELEDGGPRDHDTRLTVQGWAQQWIDQQENRVRPATHKGYRTSITRWIVPAIGHRKLHELTPTDVRAVAKSIRAEGRSTTTARLHQIVLTKLLRDAIAEGHRIPERVLHVPAPAKAISDRDAIPVEHVRALLAAAAEHTDGSRWVAALLQGMRQGECLGLTWSAVDLEAGTIDVSWQLQAIPRQEAWSRTGPLRIPDGYDHRVLVGTLCLVRPKTARGRRIIPMVPWMTAALRQWRDLAPTSPHDLVWPTSDGSPRLSSADLADWKTLQDEADVTHSAGRKYHLHEARHTTATLLLEAGVDPQTVTAILGHSSITTSRGYQHVSQALARQAMESISANLGLTSG